MICCALTMSSCDGGNASEPGGSSTTMGDEPASSTTESPTSTSVGDAGEIASSTGGSTRGAEDTEGSTSTSSAASTGSETSGGPQVHPCGADPDDPRADTWVFIMLGQSNMAGYGLCEAEDAMAADRVFKLARNMQWAAGAESFNINPWSSETGAPCSVGDGGVGPSRAMAVWIRDNVAPRDVTIHVVNAAVSGSNIESWNPDTPDANYADAVPYIQRALEDGVACGFIWHQGEANSRTEPEDYAMMFEALAEAIRTETGVPDLPIVAGEVGTTSDEGRVNQALAILERSDPNFAVATSQGLTLVDNVHYDAPSQRVYGARYADAWRSVIED